VVRRGAAVHPQGLLRARDEFAETTLLSRSSLILMKKCEFITIKDLKEFVPAYLFEPFIGLLLRKIHPQNSRASAFMRRSYYRGNPTSLFYPILYLIVIRSCVGLITHTFSFV
jgi:hypothetical protein